MCSTWTRRCSRVVESRREQSEDTTPLVVVVGRIILCWPCWPSRSASFIAGFGAATHRPCVEPGLEVSEGMYQPHYWNAPRRVVVIRKEIRRQVKGVLFEIVDWEYHAIVTTLATPAVEVWRFYNGRGDCENRIKELKYDFNGDGFCLQSFHGTEAVFRLNCFLFNLVSDFKRVVLHDMTLTLSTIRAKVFVAGVLLGRRGRNKVLRLGLTRRWKQEFEVLLDRVRTLTASTVAHLQKLLETNALEPSSPWRLRRANYPLAA